MNTNRTVFGIISSSTSICWKNIEELKITKWVNPLHPNIRMHILLTDPYSCPKVLTRRIFVTIKSFFAGDHILYSPDLNVLFRGDIVMRNQMLITLGGGGGQRMKYQSLSRTLDFLRTTHNKMIKQHDQLSPAGSNYKLWLFHCFTNLFFCRSCQFFLRSFSWPENQNHSEKNKKKEYPYHCISKTRKTPL